MDKKTDENWLNPTVDRRTFLKVSGTLASTAMAGSIFTSTKKAVAAPTPGAGVATGENLPDPVESAEDILYSVCQMCQELDPETQGNGKRLVGSRPFLRSQKKLIN